jgi:hypothetical protein
VTRKYKNISKVGDIIFHRNGSGFQKGFYSIPFYDKKERLLATISHSENEYLDIESIRIINLDDTSLRYCGGYFVDDIIKAVKEYQKKLFSNAD